ncbi:DNA-directed RNA polymerase II subunit [Rhizina undulata]
MFFFISKTRTLVLHPSYFHRAYLPFLRTNLIAQLLHETEGTTSGTACIVIADQIKQISGGLVQPGTGCAEYTFSFDALVFQVFRGQVVDGTVVGVGRGGVYVEVGPCEAFVPGNKMMTESFGWVPDGGSWGVWREAKGDGETVGVGCRVRVRLLGVRSEGGRIFAAASMNGEFLGWVVMELLLVILWEFC